MFAESHSISKKDLGYPLSLAILARWLRRHAATVAKWFSHYLYHVY